jgi:hypothetical protein
LRAWGAWDRDDSRRLARLAWLWRFAFVEVFTLLSDAVLLGGPCAEIDGLAALGAEWPKRAFGRPWNLRTASRTSHVADATRSHKLQKVSSNSTVWSTVRARASAPTDTKRTFSAYRFALISGTHSAD